MSTSEHYRQPISAAAMVIATEIGNEAADTCIEKFQQAVNASNLDDAMAYEILQNMLACIVTKALVFNCSSSALSVQQFAGEFVDTLEVHVNSVLNDSTSDNYSWR